MTLALDDRPALTWPARFADTVLGTGTGLYLRHAALFGVLVYLAYVGIVLLVSVVQPQINWDAIPYAAIAVERAYTDPAALHAYAYSTIEAQVSPTEFLALTTDGGYRSAMYADAAAFVSMLGMYRVKWLYVELLTFLSGYMNPVDALRLISMASALVFAGVSLAWLRSERSLSMAAAFAGILIVSSFTDAARAATPDMLFSALLLAGLYAHRFNRELLTTLLLVLAFLVRPDNLIFLGVYSVLLVVYRRWSWGVLAAFAICAITFLPITQMTGQPGWWKHLYFTAVERANTLEGYNPPFSIAAYLFGLTKQFVLAVTAQTWVGTALLALGGWALANTIGRPLDERQRVLVLGLLLCLPAKFLLVPVFDSRIYFGYLIAVFLVLSGNLRRPAAPAAA